MTKDFKKAEVVSGVFGDPDAPYTRYPLEALEGPERTFFTIYELDAQIGNGGFDQYFWNATEAHPTFAVQSLIDIGAYEAARIFDRAVAVGFGAAGIPADAAARHRVLDGLTDADFETLSALTDEFNARSGDLISMLYDYTAKHREAVRGAPEAFGREKQPGGWLKRLFGP